MAPAAEKRREWEPAWCPQSKRWYYQDRQRGLSSWQQPFGCEFSLPKKPPSEDAGRGEKIATRAARCSWLCGRCLRRARPAEGTSSFHKLEDEVLPEGWKAAFDTKHQAIYYFNASTLERRWSKPPPADIEAGHYAFGGSAGSTAAPPQHVSAIPGAGVGSFILPPYDTQPHEPKVGNMQTTSACRSGTARSELDARHEVAKSSAVNPLGLEKIELEFDEGCQAVFPVVAAALNEQATAAETTSTSDGSVPAGNLPRTDGPKPSRSRQHHERELPLVYASNATDRHANAHPYTDSVELVAMSLADPVSNVKATSAAHETSVITPIGNPLLGIDQPHHALVRSMAADTALHQGPEVADSFPIMQSPSFGFSAAVVNSWNSTHTTAASEPQASEGDWANCKEKLPTGLQSVNGMWQPHPEAASTTLSPQSAYAGGERPGSPLDSETSWMTASERMQTSCNGVADGTIMSPWMTTSKSELPEAQAGWNALGPMKSSKADHNEHFKWGHSSICLSPHFGQSNMEMGQADQNISGKLHIPTALPAVGENMLDDDGDGWKTPQEWSGDDLELADLEAGGKGKGQTPAAYFTWTSPIVPKLQIPVGSDMSSELDENTPPPNSSDDAAESSEKTACPHKGKAGPLADCSTSSSMKARGKGVPPGLPPAGKGRSPAALMSSPQHGRRGRPTTPRPEVSSHLIGKRSMQDLSPSSAGQAGHRGNITPRCLEKGMASPKLQAAETPFGRKIHWVQPVYEEPDSASVFGELLNPGDSGEDSEQWPQRGKSEDGTPSSLDLDTKLLTAMFGGDAGKGKATPRRSSMTKAPTGIIVLTAARAQNMAIVLSKLSITTTELCDSLRDLDFSDPRMTTENMELLVTVLPTPEESQDLLEHSENPALLRDIEQKVLPLCMLDRCVPRLKLMQIALAHGNTFQSLVQRCHAFSNAAEEVKKSKALKNVLAIVLRIMNYINHGVQEGAATGFAMESLSTLVSFRMSGVSAMHYLCLTIRAADTNSLQLLETELSHVHLASRDKTTTLIAGVGAFHKDVEFVRRELERLKRDEAAAMTASPDRMTALCQMLDSESEQLHQELERARMLGSSVQHYFNPSDSRNSIKPNEEFFNYFASFLNSLKGAWLEIERNPATWKKFLPPGEQKDESVQRRFSAESLGQRREANRLRLLSWEGNATRQRSQRGYGGSSSAPPSAGRPDGAGGTSLGAQINIRQPRAASYTCGDPKRTPAKGKRQLPIQSILPPSGARASRAGAQASPAEPIEKQAAAVAAAPSDQKEVDGWL